MLVLASADEAFGGDGDAFGEMVEGGCEGFGVDDVDGDGWGNDAGWVGDDSAFGADADDGWGVQDSGEQQGWAHAPSQAPHLDGHDRNQSSAAEQGGQALANVLERVFGASALSSACSAQEAAARTLAWRREWGLDAELAAGGGRAPGAEGAGAEEGFGRAASGGGSVGQDDGEEDDEFG